jgi:hypothetical protein
VVTNADKVRVPASSATTASANQPCAQARNAFGSRQPPPLGVSLPRPPGSSCSSHAAVLWESLARLREFEHGVLVVDLVRDVASRIAADRQTVSPRATSWLPVAAFGCTGSDVGSAVGVGMCRAERGLRPSYRAIASSGLLRGA